MLDKISHRMTKHSEAIQSGGKKEGTGIGLDFVLSLE